MFQVAGYRGVGCLALDNRHLDEIYWIFLWYKFS